MSEQKWTVEIPHEELEQIRQARKDAELKVVQLKAELATTKLGGDDSIASGLVVSIRDAMKIVQWAQGNYDPETVRGWPFESLRALAKAVQAMPGATPHELEWANDALGYANMAEVVERARKVGRQKELSQISRGVLAQSPLAYAAAVEGILSEPPQQHRAGGEQGKASKKWRWPWSKQ